jgi:hypothetical protein
VTYTWSITKVSGYRRAMINDGEIADDPNNTDEELELNEKEQIMASDLIKSRINIGDES